MIIHRPPHPCPVCGEQCPAIPNPITLTCIRCTKPFVTDADSRAAKDRICLCCYFGPELAVILGETPGPG